MPKGLLRFSAKKNGSMCIIETNYSHLCGLKNREMIKWLSRYVLSGEPPWCHGEERCGSEGQCVECVYRWLMEKYRFEKENNYGLLD